MVPRNSGIEGADPKTDRRLRLLAILLRAYTAVLALAACFMVGFFSLLIRDLWHTAQIQENPPPPFAHAILSVMPIGILFGLAPLIAAGVLFWKSAAWIELRQNYSWVVAARVLTFISLPIGPLFAAYAVSTIYRKDVKEAFALNDRRPDAA